MAPPARDNANKKYKLKMKKSYKDEEKEYKTVKNKHTANRGEMTMEYMCVMRSQNMTYHDMRESIREVIKEGIKGNKNKYDARSEIRDILASAIGHMIRRLEQSQEIIGCPKDRKEMSRFVSRELFNGEHEDNNVDETVKKIAQDWLASQGMTFHQTTSSTQELSSETIKAPNSSTESTTESSTTSAVNPSVEEKMLVKNIHMVHPSPSENVPSIATDASSEDIDSLSWLDGIYSSSNQHHDISQIHLTMLEPTSPTVLQGIGTCEDQDQDTFSFLSNSLCQTPPMSILQACIPNLDDHTNPGNRYSSGHASAMTATTVPITAFEILEEGDDVLSQLNSSPSQQVQPIDDVAIVNEIPMSYTNKRPRIIISTGNDMTAASSSGRGLVISGTSSTHPITNGFSEATLYPSPPEPSYAIDNVGFTFPSTIISTSSSSGTVVHPPNHDFSPQDQPPPQFKSTMSSPHGNGDKKIMTTDDSPSLPLIAPLTHQSLKDVVEIYLKHDEARICDVHTHWKEVRQDFYDNARSESDKNIVDLVFVKGIYSLHEASICWHDRGYDCKDIQERMLIEVVRRVMYDVTRLQRNIRANKNVMDHVAKMKSMAVKSIKLVYVVKGSLPNFYMKWDIFSCLGTMIRGLECVVNSSMNETDDDGSDC